MRKLIQEIKQSFKERPLWTLYSLALAPIFYLLILSAAAMLAIITLRISDAGEFLRKLR